ncbi:MAG: phosphoserine phosphatase SerB [Collinsella sp.]
MTARLIVMDIDSTLINQEVIDLLGEEAGVGEQVAQITERAMRGELFKQALEERVGLLAGLDESVFERTFERVTFTPGALELVRSAHSKGWKVGVVSGGFHEVADKIVAAAGIDFCLATRLEVVDDKLAGKLAADIVTKESKLIQLLDWAAECRYGPHVAIGDAANDIPMIRPRARASRFAPSPRRARQPRLPATSAT